MIKDRYIQSKIAARKTLRLDMNTDVIRLAKAKAAGQEVRLWWVTERLLAAWVRGDISLNGGAK